MKKFFEWTVKVCVGVYILLVIILIYQDLKSGGRLDIGFSATICAFPLLAIGFPAHFLWKTYPLPRMGKVIAYTLFFSMSALVITACVMIMSNATF